MKGTRRMHNNWDVDLALIVIIYTLSSLEKFMDNMQSFYEGHRQNHALST